MATTQELYAALKLPDDAGIDRQFVAFTLNGMQIAGGADLRAIINGLGYDDPGRIRIADSGLLDSYRTLAQDISASITSTVNDMLQTAIDRLPDGLSLADARAELSPFFDSVHQYNSDTLLPFIDASARQQAQDAFYANNTSPATGKSLTDSVLWDWTQNTDFDDECADAQAASPASYDDLTGIAGDSPPVHRNCTCTCDPQELDASDLPAQGDLWTGQDTGESSNGHQLYEKMNLRDLDVVALDLDDTALSPDYAPILVPITTMLAENSVKVGVLTGNRTWTDGGAARTLWDTLGYPSPDFEETHALTDQGNIARWKAQACKERDVKLLIDDFRHGTVLPVFLKTKPDFTRVFVVPYLPGAPVQAVEAIEQEIVRQQSTKYHVPRERIDAVRQRMATMLEPDEHDPNFLGQDVRSTYFDTPGLRLRTARVGDIDYVTVRFRHYGNGETEFLEAKTPDAKYRVAYDGPLGSLDLEHICTCIPEIAEPLRRLVCDQPLAPVATVIARRYARQRGVARITLDTDIQTDTGRIYDGAVLELKSQTGPVPSMPLDGLAPLRAFSKFLWSGGT